MTELEFTLKLLQAVPSARVAPHDQHELETRDPATIEQWEQEGRKLVVLGVRLKEKAS
jgi:hypothetical protein